MSDECMMSDRTEDEGQDIKTVQTLKRRLSSYYFFEGVRNSSLFSKRMKRCHHYFFTLRELAKGRSPNSIAKELGLNHSVPLRWSHGQLPDFVRLAIQIPFHAPKSQHKWLPLKFVGKFTPSNFVEVPVKISSFEQIAAVVANLDSYQITRKNRVQISKIEAFAYILGLLVSHSEKQGSPDFPSKIMISLSKKYSWAKQAGETICSLLKILGIRVDEVRGSGAKEIAERRFSWRTGRSSLISWMLKSVLGIKKIGDFSHFSQYSAWLLKAPFRVRLRFIHALFDGSGSASVSSQVVSLTCRGYERFAMNLLKSVGIESGEEGHQVRIRKTEAINRAAGLPVFWLATTRQTNIEKLVKMLAARRGRGRKAYSPQIISRIRELAEQGLAFGAIAEQLFDESGISLPKTTVRRLATK